MNILRFIDRIIAVVEGWFIIISLSLMVILTFFLVFLRALYTYLHLHWANIILGSVDWTESLVRLLVLWITFLGASLITKDNKHIKIDIMSAILPARWLPVRELILSLACVIITFLMIKASIGYVKTEMNFGGFIFLKLPVWVGQLIIPLGFSLLLFRFVLRGMEQILDLFKGTRT
jgi:TRAP-type C4-dicarboxylate transport system permease small subunit